MISKIKPVHLIRAIRPEGKKRRTREMRIAGTPRLKRHVDPEMPDSWRELVPRIGERRIREMVRLLKRGIKGTTPELTTYAWLDRQGVQFAFQSSFYAGKMVKGGVVADFILYNQPNGVTAVEVLGLYWHPARVRATSDIRKRIALLKSGYYDGLKVKAVVWIDEDSIFDRYERTMEDMMAGVSSIGVESD